jgi:hypothetical protein
VPAELVDEVTRCVDRTRDEASARVVFVRGHDFEWPRSKRRGGLLRPAGKAVRIVGRAAWRRVSGGFNWGHVEAEGYIEPRARRCMLDHGGFAQLYKDGEWWSGASGAPLAPVHHDGQRIQQDVWWLLDIALGAFEATDVGVDDVRGTKCRRIRVTVDMARASDAAGAGLAVPLVERFDELRAIPVEVWIDGERLRRVRHTAGREGLEQTVVLELWDFGADTAGLDWSRLPALRPVD